MTVRGAITPPWENVVPSLFTSLGSSFFSSTTFKQVKNQDSTKNLQPYFPRGTGKLVFWLFGRYKLRFSTLPAIESSPTKNLNLTLMTKNYDFQNTFLHLFMFYSLCDGPEGTTFAESMEKNCKERIQCIREMECIFELQQFK